MRPRARAVWRRDSFGGDQFVIPGQELLLQGFFSIFYFSINLGSFLSIIVSPILRGDVQAGGQRGGRRAARARQRRRGFG